MTFSLNILPIHRSHQLLRSVWEVGSLCWPGSAAGGASSGCRGWLRRFLLLKLVTVLLSPHGAGIPLLVGCIQSLRALLLLRSPHISTKPSTVFLGQLAVSDGLVLLHWLLRLAAAFAQWTDEASCEGEMWRDTLSTICQQLLEAHHLASLLLLGLLGLEATLVSRWPLQTRRFRTSHWAQLSCSLVWLFVLLEVVLSINPQIVQDPGPQIPSASTTDSQTSFVGLVPPSCLTDFSPCLRRTLWLMNLWLHFAFFFSKPQRRKSSFH